MPTHALERFREAISSMGERADDGIAELHRTVDSLVDICREAGWKAEQIVVAMNVAWNDAVDRGIVPRDDVHRKLRRDTVTKAIEAYYLH